MPELRKRKAPAGAAALPPVKKANSIRSSASKVEDVLGTSGSTLATKVAVGDAIDIENFGGEIETNDGEKVTLKKLVEDSSNGVVLFTYPKASTSTCTTQARLFRDEFNALTATGFAIYGLSTDSPTANTNFKMKQNLPYTLLCDPKATLIAAIGMRKPPASTSRGVFVVDKASNVKAVSPGNPAATVEAVRSLVEANGAAVSPDIAKAARRKKFETMEQDDDINAAKAERQHVSTDERAGADVASQVADSAMELDGEAKAHGVQQSAALEMGEEKAIVAAEVADTAQTLDR